MDKYQFAKFVQWLQAHGLQELANDELIELDGFIISTYANVDFNTMVNEIDNLMKAIYDGRKIEAIKSHRALTGMTLKGSKDAVEKYWHVLTNDEKSNN